MVAPVEELLVVTSFVEPTFQESRLIVAIFT
jgi:hypothetical protein